MKIYTTFKPTLTLSSPVNKQTMLKAILAGTCPSTYNNVINGHMHFVNGVLCVRLYNLIKHNRKVKRLGGGLYTKNGNKHIKMPAYWEAYVYDIPVTIIETLNLKVIQNNRNFTITNNINSVNYKISE